MPNIFRKGIPTLAAFTFAIGVTTCPVSAQNYGKDQNILILEEAFFPKVSYVKNGDKLTFINHAEQVRVVTGTNDAWTSGVLAKGATFVYVVNGSSPLEFTSIFGGEDGIIYQGTLSYDDPPLSMELIDEDNTGEAVGAD